MFLNCFPMYAACAAVLKAIIAPAVERQLALMGSRATSRIRSQWQTAGPPEHYGYPLVPLIALHFLPPGLTHHVTVVSHTPFLLAYLLHFMLPMAASGNVFSLICMFLI
jgi:hypothetical protein